MEEEKIFDSQQPVKTEIEQLQEKISLLEKENLTLKEKLKKLAPLNLKKKPKDKGKKNKEDLLEKFETAKIALKIAYNGKNYQGFASQENIPDTIEEKLFDAIELVKLIKDRDSSDYSRCGRTDKGVSSLGNIIALRFRTKRAKNSQPEKPIDEEELHDYVKMLNGNLPPDIRVLGQALVDNSFNARYHCKYRIYKYFFYKAEYNTDKILEAAKKFIGTHDFRNFCKFNLTSNTSHVREIFDVTLEEVDFPSESVLIDPRMKLYTFTIKGNGFLWHQIRCMMAILFMVGQNAEEPSIVEEMLDIQKYPRKPNYELAPEANLILYDCIFENLKFAYHYHNCYKLVEKMRENILEDMAGIIFYNFGLRMLFSFDVKEGKCYPDEDLEASDRLDKKFLEDDSKVLKEYKNTHKKLCTRQTGKSFEETAEGLSGKKLKIFQEKMQKQTDYEQSLLTD